MTLTAGDWRILRNALLALAGVLALGAAMVFFSRQELIASRDMLDQQQAALRQAQERYRRSGDEKIKILRYRDSYLALQQHGFVGDEQRINWVDALRAASLGLKMFGVNYQIETQQTVSAGADAGRYQMRQSLMKISMGLLHEEDLMRFIRAVEQQQVGLFDLRECSLERHAAAGAGIQPNLSGECSLAWLTISELPAGDKP